MVRLIFYNLQLLWLISTLVFCQLIYHISKVQTKQTYNSATFLCHHAVIKWNATSGSNIVTITHRMYCPCFVGPLSNNHDHINTWMLATVLQLLNEHYVLLCPSCFFCFFACNNTSWSEIWFLIVAFCNTMW
jgi:hypothetical protein